MNKTIKTTIALIGLIIGILMAWQLRTIVGYIIIAVILTLVGRPIMKGLGKIQIKNRTIPNSIKSLVTLVLISSLLSGVFSLFIPLVLEEARILSSIDYEELYEKLGVPLKGLEDWLKSSHLINSNDSIENQLANIFNLSQIGGIFNSLIGVFSNILISVFSILFITFFLLKEQNLSNRLITGLSPQKYVDQIKSAITNAKSLLTRYFIGIFFQISIITIIVSTGLGLLEIKNALLIGFLAGLINVIPYIGPIIGAVIGIFIGISTNLDLDFHTQLLPLTLKIMAIFGAMQMIDNFILQPLIFSNSVYAHPLEIFLIVISAGSLFGVLGMIVAIPIYTIFRVIAKEFLSEFRLIQQITKNI